jgi:hypothetical protein
MRIRSTNKRRIANGRELLRLYSERKVRRPLKRLDNCLLIGAIADLLHYACSKGFDVESIHRNALEQQVAETIESCPKCGTPVARGDAVMDLGQGEEIGRMFYYCSKECKQNH